MLNTIARWLMRQLYRWTPELTIYERRGTLVPIGTGGDAFDPPDEAITANLPKVAKEGDRAIVGMPGGGHRHYEHNAGTWTRKPCGDSPHPDPSAPGQLAQNVEDALDRMSRKPSHLRPTKFIQ